MNSVRLYKTAYTAYQLIIVFQTCAVKPFLCKPNSYFEVSRYTITRFFYKGVMQRLLQAY